MNCCLIVFNPKLLIHCDQNFIHHSSIQVDSICMMSVQKTFDCAENLSLKTSDGCITIGCGLGDWILLLWFIQS